MVILFNFLYDLARLGCHMLSGAFLVFLFGFLTLHFCKLNFPVNLSCFLVSDKLIGSAVVVVGGWEGSESARLVFELLLYFFLCFQLDFLLLTPLHIFIVKFINDAFRFRFRKTFMGELSLFWGLRHSSITPKLVEPLLPAHQNFPLLRYHFIR